MYRFPEPLLPKIAEYCRTRKISEQAAASKILEEGLVRINPEAVSITPILVYEGELAIKTIRIRKDVRDSLVLKAKDLNTSANNLFVMCLQEVLLSSHPL